MDNRSRNRALWLACLGFGLVLLLGAGALCREPSLARQRLKDGRTLTYLGIGYGTRHRFIDGPLWQQVWKSWQPPDAYDVTTLTRPVLALWGRCPARGAFRWVDPGLLDEHGCRFEPQPFIRDSTGSPDRAEWFFPAFPRRSSHFSASAAPASLVGEWEPGESVRLPNPTQVSHAQWTAEPYPVRRRFGRTEVVLEQLRPGSAPGERLPVFRFRENGKPTDAWEAEHAKMSDATGNEWFCARYGGKPLKLSGLCGREAAWKLNVLFVRPRPRETKPDAVLTVRDVRVPVPSGPSVSRLLIQRFTTPGVQSGGLRLRVTGGARDSREQPPRLYVEASGEGEWQVTLASVTDARGRRFPVASEQADLLERTSSSQILGSGEFAPDIPAGVRRVNLKFLAHRVHRAEFLAKP
jgi:hypothetical protein